MSGNRTDDVIERLAAQAGAAPSLGSPMRRALVTLAALALLGTVAILGFSDMSPFAGREGERWMLSLEMLAMLATGALAIVAAFHLAVPGRSRAWRFAPLPALAIWLLLSGIGCLAAGSAGLPAGHETSCLSFILGASAVLAPLLIWRLSRARPFDPLPVAVSAGVGVAALAAFVLQFFHPFSLTFADLGMHIAAVLIVVGVLSLLRRPVLRAA